jgi:salicylate hydroxylase
MALGSRVESYEYAKRNVTVATSDGCKYTFDLLIGADGIKSTIRSSLLPDATPQAASTVAAFRGILPYEKVFQEVPEARQFLRNSMDAWVGPNGYILLYPLTAGTELNVVTIFQMGRIVKTPEDKDVQDFQNLYKDWSPVIKKIIGLIEHTQIWPLLVLPPMKSWSNEHKNVVLLGDAAHCMQNHMVRHPPAVVEA